MTVPIIGLKEKMAMMNYFLIMIHKLLNIKDY